MEKILAGAPCGIFMTIHCFFNRRLYGGALYQAQIHKVRCDRIVTYGYQSNEMSQFLMVMEVVPQAFQCRKLTDIEKILIGANL